MYFFLPFTILGFIFLCRKKNVQNDLRRNEDKVWSRSKILSIDSASNHSSLPTKVLVASLTFDQMDEQIGFVEIIREAEVKPTQWYSAAATSGQTASSARSRTGRSRTCPYWSGTAVHLWMNGLLGVIGRRGIAVGLIQEVLIVSWQTNVNGRLAFIEIRLEGTQRGRSRSYWCRSCRTVQRTSWSLTLIWISRRWWLNRIHFCQRAEHRRSTTTHQRRGRSWRRNGRVANRWRSQRIDQRREWRSRTDQWTRVRCQIQIVAANQAAVGTSDVAVST